MATKKKAATTAATEPQNKVPEEAAKVIMDPDASTAEKLNVLQGLADSLPDQKQEPQEPEPEKEAPASENQDDQGQEQPEPESAKELSDPEKQEPQEPEKEPEPITKDTPCPFEATVSVALAVLRKNTGLGTSEMLRPVATLKQGTKVTVTAVRDGGCLLRNGLWIAAEYITK